MGVMLELGTLSGHPRTHFQALRELSSPHFQDNEESGAGTPGHTSKSLRQWLVRNTPLTACVCNWVGVRERQPTHYSARQTAGTWSGAVMSGAGGLRALFRTRSHTGEHRGQPALSCHCPR